MSWLAKSNKIFLNAENRRHKLHRLPTPDPIKAILSDTRTCFSLLKDEDGESVKTLKWFLWNLRQSVILGLLPFDSEHLGLQDLISELNSVKIYYPTVIGNIDGIIGATQFLLENPFNPKRERVFALLKECDFSHEMHGLVSLLSGGSVLGWGDVLNKEINDVSPGCLIISSRKVLLSNAYDRIIIPSGGKSSPILNELLNCSYGEVTESVAYDREYIVSPRENGLSVGSRNYRTRKEPSSEINTPEDQGQDSISDWEKREYWNSFRSRHGIKEISDSDLQHVVKARLIILPGNKIVYLRDNSKVINLIGMIGERVSYIRQIRKFPRTPVGDLREGDLIVLRTSGSGDYLLDVVDMLISKTGCHDLKEIALGWKSHLCEALRKEGPLKVFNCLKSKGHDFCSHMYLWEWTTNHVIGPANDSKFFELMAILDDLGYLPEGTDVVRYAEEKWSAMKELKSFHQRAGAFIRKELMDEIKRVLESGTPVGDKLSLNLKGVSSGTLSVFRVVAVDPESRLLPYSEVGVIRKVRI